MPRNSLAAVLALLLISGPALAKAPVCGSRVQAYNEYEELNKEKQIDVKVSIFDPTEWGPNSAYEGLLVKAGEDAKTKVEVEVRKTGKSKGTVKKEFGLGKWGERADFLIAQNFNEGKGLFSEKYDIAGTYVIRLKLDGKVLCEDAARKIEAGH